jgi:hypothetical protein
VQCEQEEVGRWRLWLLEKRSRGRERRRERRRLGESSREAAAAALIVAPTWVQKGAGHPRHPCPQRDTSC